VIPPFAVYLFDIDGTLLDSAPDICGAAREVLSKTSCNGVPDSFLRRYIGRHLVEMFQDALPAYTPDQIGELVQTYRAVYLAREHRLTAVYPGVGEALRLLRGLKSTATTKGTATSRSVLEKFGLLRHFDHVQGTDGFPSKPAPDVIFAALRALSAPPEGCLLVGDSTADMEAGRLAGVKTCAVRYGYGDLEELAGWKPDYWISDLGQLIS
jgi:HAD superfamily hydrolase (TIGR01509 family)